MNKICGTCRHWKEPDGNDRFPCGWNSSIYGRCNRLGMNFDGEQERGDIAGVEDGSGYHAAVRCKTDFGCKLWESKDEDNRDNRERLLRSQDGPQTL